MRIVDGWPVQVFMGRDWGVSWISILFIIIGFMAIMAAIDIKHFTFPQIVLYLLAAVCLLAACHAKPIYKNIIEYKIECNEYATVNDFFHRFELQEVIDESHYLVRERDWENLD